MKQWVLIGAPKAATALLYLIKEERKEDRDLEFTKYVVIKVLLVFWFLLVLSICYPIPRCPSLPLWFDRDIPFN